MSRTFPEDGVLPFTKREVDQLDELLQGEETDFGVVIFVGPQELALLERAVSRLEAGVAERNRTPSGN